MYGIPLADVRVSVRDRFFLDHFVLLIALDYEGWGYGGGTHRRTGRPRPAWLWSMRRKMRKTRPKERGVHATDGGLRAVQRMNEATTLDMERGTRWYKSAGKWCGNGAVPGGTRW